MFKTTLLASLFTAFVSLQAAAYTEKTYECRSGEGLPDNTYKIQNVTVAPGVVLPYVEITRHFGGGDTPAREFTVKGLATVSSSAPNKQILSVAAIRLEFEDDNLVNCRE